MTHGQNILLADDAETFAASVISLLTDADRRRQLGRAASQLAARYDWSVIAESFEQSLARVAANTEAARELEAAPASAGV